MGQNRRLWNTLYVTRRDLTPALVLWLAIVPGLLFGADFNVLSRSSNLVLAGTADDRVLFPENVSVFSDNPAPAPIPSYTLYVETAAGDELEISVFAPDSGASEGLNDGLGDEADDQRGSDALGDEAKDQRGSDALGDEAANQPGHEFRHRYWNAKDSSAYRGPLLIWLVNQYGELTTPNFVIQSVAAQGITVWRVDLLDSMMLDRSTDTVRNLDGEAVAALLAGAVAEGFGPIGLVAMDRMAAPLLRGLRRWQEQAPDLTPVAGGILLYPNLYRGTPVAGEEPELLGIVGATNFPLVVFQPALGAHRGRVNDLLKAFYAAGSPAYLWLVPEMRDYYLLQSEAAENLALEPTPGPLPEAVHAAIAATPGQLRNALRLLAHAPRPTSAAQWLPATDAPLPPVLGLVERAPYPAPDFALIDALGIHHQLEDSLGRVTLVNFWATWCPPCVHEIPSMNRLAGAYAPEDFAIVSINFREDPEHILQFMREVAVDFPVLLDSDGHVAQSWGVFAFPSSFILDRDGQVRYSVNTAIEWDAPEIHRAIGGLGALPQR